MLASALGLLVAVLVNAVAFFALRYLAAPKIIAAEPRVVLGLDRGPWGGVSISRKLLFVAAGPFGCYLAAACFITIGLLASGKTVIDETSMRVTVAPSGAGARAGVEAHDKITTIDGAPVRDWDGLKKMIAAHPGEEIHVGVERDGKPLDLPVTPSAEGKIGVGPAVDHVSIGVGAALSEGLTEPIGVWRATVKGILRILTAHEHAELSGPVGVVKATDEAATSSVGTAVHLVGLVNAYYLFIPAIIALVLFPRKPRAPR